MLNLQMDIDRLGEIHNVTTEMKPIFLNTKAQILLLDNAILINDLFLQSSQWFCNQLSYLHNEITYKVAL